MSPHNLPVRLVPPLSIVLRLEVLIAFEEEVRTSMMHRMGVHQPQTNSDLDAGREIPVSAHQSAASVNPQLLLQLEGMASISISASYCIPILTINRVLSTSVWRNPDYRSICQSV